MVVTETLERGRQAIDVATGARNEAERTHGRGPTQSLQIGCGLESCVYLAVADGCDLNLVGLRIGSVCQGTERRHSQ